LAVGAYPYTPDGFFELFTNVIAVYLTGGTETSATTSIDCSTGPATVVVTPVSMTSIAVNVRLVVDVGDEAETVVVKAVTATTFTARFTKTHTTAGYPIATESGVARLRLLLHEADRAHDTMLGASVAAQGGIRSVDKGEVEWFGPVGVMKAHWEQYRGIVARISSLVRVPPVEMGGGQGRMEAY
jgi:hypothetical protein